MSKRIVILGSGESGVGSAILALAKGFDVFVSDRNTIQEKYKTQLVEHQINFEEGTHTLEKILNAHEIIKSPGIPDKAEIIVKAKEKNISVISEIEFAGRYTQAKKICITGSNGKTTTTLLTYHILKKAGYNVGLAGNVGKSFAYQVAKENFDYYVLELSSFQLDGMYQFKADVAVLLNITPDHLDRYDYKFENYVASKFRITQNLTSNDSFVYCADDEAMQEYMKHHAFQAELVPFSIKKKIDGNGAYLINNEITLNYNNNPKPLIMTIEQLALAGKHNVYNSMAASMAARIVDIRKDIIRESLEDFVNVEHRLEFVSSINGVEFINDSKATNVNSAWYALESMQKPTVWIMGGQDKGNNYEELIDLVKEKVKAIVCLGVNNKKIIKAFKGTVETIIETGSAAEAVAVANKLATKGDAVLLSPACASFDLFENYEDRGQQFKAAVRSL
ncbi:MAG: UDP-N-acetylmuramoyl-L-alanine--D-glutamate ligase [Bacteroidia bacterium]|nr:UDP-N-acetylmuramoyl-L-alanine--D-glutamate ligase [Bacteroidia bacterium]